MNSDQYLLGIDLGTSGVRAVVAGRDGQIMGLGRGEYPIDTPQADWAEQNPASWIDATVDAVRQSLAQSGAEANQIAGIGLSGQMHSTVCLDADGNVLRPAIIWADQRSKQEVGYVYQRVGPGVLGKWTANPLATGFTLASLLWLRRHEPRNFERISIVLLPKDYLRYYLTGNFGTDFSDASATALMNVATRHWNQELLDTFGIGESILPNVSESCDVAGGLRPEAALALGLCEGIPVVFGGGDQSVQAVGNRIVTPGLLSSTIGTGGQLFAPVSSPFFDPDLRMHTFCHAVPGAWHMMAAILAAGLSFSWWRGKVLEAGSFDELADAAGEVEIGADGLFFLPYLLGERTPHMDPNARGAFVGLTLRHGRAHLTRAVMEGVVLALREGLQIMLDVGARVDTVVASGGGSRHPLWLQLQADIFDREIYQADGEEAACRGAAILAGVGVGIYPDVYTACRRTVRWKDVVTSPIPANVDRFHRVFEEYRRLYPALRSVATDPLG